MATQTIQVASFNVENLLHAGARFAREPGEPGYTPEMYADKVRWIAGILDEGEVDLVGFQELFSAKSLSDALAGSKRLKNARVFAPNLVDNIAVDPGGIELAKGPFVGLATTLEVLSERAISDFPAEVVAGLTVAGDGDPVSLPVTRFQRPVIEVKVKLPNGTNATVFVAHLKSKLGQFMAGENRKDPLVIALASTRSLVIRAAESVALRKLALDAMVDNSDAVFVIGDLNDELPSVTTQTIAGPLPFGKASAEIFDRVLYSVHDIQNRNTLRDVDYTHIFDSRYQVLDHIFVSQELYFRNPARVGEVRNTRIFNDHLVDTGLAVNVHSGLSARSDHGVVIAQIVLKAPAAPA